MASDESQTAGEGSKMDALVKVVLVFFISLLSFSVGTFVGKQVSDSDHRQAALEGDHGTDGHSTAEAEEHGTAETDREVASVDGEQGPTISDEDVNNLADEFLHKDAKTETVAATPDQNGYKSFNKKSEAAPAQAASAHAPAAAPTKAAAAATHTPTPANPAAQKVLKGESPTSGKVVEEKRQPSSVLPTAGGSAVGKFTVQVASYATEDEAKRHASTLKTKGWSAFYIPADIKGKTWYRVSVGLFDDSGNAKTFMQKFQKESGSKSALVQKIVQ